jgi:tRNA pseudouridine38-40 synthase
VCAGRTDAGVHALGQVVGYAGAPDGASHADLKLSLNRLMAPSVAVTASYAMPEDWHARYSARSRTYIYAILEGDPHHPFYAGTAWHHPAILDVDRMNEAAGHLLGEQDFSSFGRLPDPDASRVRTLFELSTRRSGRMVLIKARASAFIQQMVRSLVGTLVQVGEGAQSPDAMNEVLAARDRGAAGPVAPPHGLCLVAVEYDDGWSTPAAGPGQAV